MLISVFFLVERGPLYIKNKKKQKKKILCRVPCRRHTAKLPYWHAGWPFCRLQRPAHGKSDHSLPCAKPQHTAKWPLVVVCRPAGTRQKKWAPQLPHKKRSQKNAAPMAHAPFFAVCRRAGTRQRSPSPAPSKRCSVCIFMLPCAWIWHTANKPFDV